MVDIPHFDMGTRVPRVIHQVFISDGPLAEELADNIQKICRVNNTWAHRLYGHDDIEAIILKYYGPDILKTYRKVSARYVAARTDFFRYLLMYAEGGFYLDLKGSTNLPLDELLTPDDRLILSQWNNGDGEEHPGWGIHPKLAAIEGGEYQQWQILAVAGHPFLRAVIERVIHNIEHYNILRDGVGRDATLAVTGPIAFSLAIEEVRSRHPYRLVDIRNDFGVEYSIYDAPGQTKSHQNAFRARHYARLKSPLIKPSSLKDPVRMAVFYADMTLFYLKKYVPIVMRRIFSGNR
jgi:inositol phosphorylceramide mannosyltransferase catalytic subunit